MTDFRWHIDPGGPKAILLYAGSEFESSLRLYLCLRVANSRIRPAEDASEEFNVRPRLRHPRLF